jgi:hypothetical protein
MQQIRFKISPFQRKLAGFNFTHSRVIASCFSSITMNWLVGVKFYPKLKTLEKTIPLRLSS